MEFGLQIPPQIFNNVQVGRLRGEGERGKQYVLFPSHALQTIFGQFQQCGYAPCHLDKVGIFQEIKSEQKEAADPPEYRHNEQL